MNSTQEIPFISVVIPVHNRTEELKRAIDSVLKQTHARLEVLVMDDASTENLEAIVQDFKSDKIRFFRKEIKSNANVLRNLGVQQSRGQFIAFLDSDDEWMPDHLQRKLEELYESKVEGVYGGAFVDDGSERNYAESKEIPSAMSPLEYLLSIGVAQTSSWLVNADAAKDILFDPSLHRHQDYDFFIRFAKKYRWKACWFPTMVIHWRAGGVRTFSTGSEIPFIQRNFKDISPKIYSRYHLTLFGYYIQAKADSDIIHYYRTECLRYCYQLAFVDYCTLFSHRKGPIGFFRNWLGFSMLLFARKFVQPAPPSLPKGISA